MSIQALLHQARQEGIQIRADAGQVKLAGPSDLIQKWRPLLAPHKTELLEQLAANDSASIRANLPRVASSTKGEGVGQGRTAFDQTDAIVDDLAALIQAAADFWGYDADDLAIIHDLATRDPEGIRLSLTTDPLRPFYGAGTVNDTKLGSKA